MTQNTLRKSALGAFFLVLALTSGTSFAAGSPDLTIETINASAVRCGTGRCGGDVTVDVGNRGRALQGGYNIFVELKVYEQGQGQRAKTYKEKLFNFPGERSETFTFKGIQVQRCNRPYIFEAKVYVVGGNFREGNTRNNDKQVTSYVRNSCSASSGSTNSSSGSKTGSGSNRPSTGSTGSGSHDRPDGGSSSSSKSGGSKTGASPDLLIPSIRPNVQCGSSCRAGTVDVEVKNAGRALNGGYNVFVELKVYEQGQGQRARTYKEKTFNFPGESSKTFTFDRIQVQRCNRPYVFEAKVYVVGGNFREGNTRNNAYQVTETIRQACR